MTVLRAGAASDVGHVREINEDRFLVTDQLFAVADGVGGHQAGEVAAETAMQSLHAAFAGLAEPSVDGLIDAIEGANHAVWRLAHDTPDKRGMGTTLTALALVEEDGEERLAVANVGDSRVYLLQQGELLQLTEDHSLVEEMVRDGQLTPAEARDHPQKSVITRALGLADEVDVDTWELLPYAGDRLLLCSDGLTNEVTDDDIAGPLRQFEDPQEAAEELVRRALDHGGGDNVTVVVVDVLDDDRRSERASAALAAEARERASAAGTASGPPTGVMAAVEDEPVRTAVRPMVATAPPPHAGAGPQAPGSPAGRSRFTWRVGLFVALLLLVIVGALAAIGWYARGTYYVGVAGDQVAIYRGRPGGLLWFQPTLQERKNLSVHDLPEGSQARLRQGKVEPTKASADRYVNRLRTQVAENQPPDEAPPTGLPTPGTQP